MRKKYLFSSTLGLLLLCLPLSLSAKENTATALKQPDWVASGWENIGQHRVAEALEKWQQGVNHLPPDQLLAFLGVYKQITAAERELKRVGLKERAILLRAPFKGEYAYYLLSARVTPADKASRRAKLSSLYRVMHHPDVIYAMAASRFRSETATQKTATPISKIIFHGNKLVANSMIEKSLRAYKGRSNTQSNLFQIRQSIIALYEQQGFHHVAVSLPKRSESGAVTVTIYENDIRYTGSRPNADHLVSEPSKDKNNTTNWVASGWRQLETRGEDSALAIWQAGVNRLPANRLLAFLGAYRQLSTAIRFARQGGASEQVVVLRAGLKGKSGYYVMSVRDVPKNRADRPEKLASLYKAMHLSGALYANTAEKFQSKKTAPAMLKPVADTFTVRGFHISGNALVDSTDIRKVLSHFTGKNKTRVDLIAAKQAILRLYRNAGYEMVAVGLPRKVDSEIVPIRIFEARIGKVWVSGGKKSLHKKIKSSMTALKPGKTALANKVDEQLRNLSQKHHIQSAQLIYHPTDEGSVDVEIAVDVKNPVKLGVMVSSLGTQETGQTLVTGIFHHNDLWGEGHQLTLSGTVSEKPQKLQVFSALYEIPMEAVDGKFMLSFSRANVVSGKVQAVLDSRGNGTLASAHYEQTILRLGRVRHFLTAGYEQHKFLEKFSNPAAPVTFSIGVLTKPVVLGYGMEGKFDQWQSNLNVSYYHNTPLGATKGNTSYRLLNPASFANWSFLRMSADFMYNWNNGWSFSEKLAGQISNNALISGERFYITGLSKVRGFEEVEASGDTAFFSRSELISPYWLKNTRFHLFVDAGRYKLNFPLPGEFGSDKIVSTGLGLHWMSSFGLDVLGEAGVVLNGLPVAPNGSMTGHFKVVYWFQ